MSLPVIEATGLTKRYRLGYVGAGSLRDELAGAWNRLRGQTGEEASAHELWALRDVGFSIQPGETVGVLGRNGAGKSTLLKVLSRVTEPSAGEAIIRGRTASLLEVGTGFHPELSGRDNVFISGAILGMKRAETSRKFDAIVDFAGVARFIDTPVKRYSSGMYVRLAFAVAAHLDPEVLFVDEVLAVGDSQFQMKCIEKMKELTRSGKTILFVSHNLYLLQTLCSRGIYLRQGQIAADGDIHEALAAYRSELGEKEDEDQQALRGSDAVELTGWTFNGNPDRMIEVQGAFDLEIAWDLEVKQATTLYFGMALRTADGVWISGHSSYLENLPQAYEPGTHRASIRLPQINLPSGSYFIQLSILDENGQASHANVRNAGVLTVARRDDFVGLVGLPHQWTTTGD